MGFQVEAVEVHRRLQEFGRRLEDSERVVDRTMALVAEECPSGEGRRETAAREEEEAAAGTLHQASTSTKTRMRRRTRRKRRLVPERRCEVGVRWSSTALTFEGAWRRSRRC